MMDLGPGNPSLFGATPSPGGCDFTVFSKHATAVTLVFFDGPRDARPSRSIVLDPSVHRTGDVWHIRVAGVGHGQLYGWLADGPWEPEGPGHRFNRHKLLLDPYAQAVVGRYDWNRPEAYSYDRFGPGTVPVPNRSRRPRPIRGPTGPSRKRSPTSKTSG